LIFYKERPGAIVTLRKKFIVARLGDACLCWQWYYALNNQFGQAIWKIFFTALKNAIATGQTWRAYRIAALSGSSSTVEVCTIPTTWMAE